MGTYSHDLSSAPRWVKAVLTFVEVLSWGVNGLVSFFLLSTFLSLIFPFLSRDLSLEKSLTIIFSLFIFSMFLSITVRWWLSDAYGERRDRTYYRDGTYYRDFSSAPRWFKTLWTCSRKVTGVGGIFLFLGVGLFGVLTLGGHVHVVILVFIMYRSMSNLMSNLVDHVYGKLCDASRKGQPWVIEFNDDRDHYYGGAGGGDGGGGCGGGGCGGD